MSLALPTLTKIVPAYLTWTDDGGLPHEFHCFVRSEDYDFAVDVTEHPVETGSDVTDNVRIKPREATIVFFETNSPIDANNWSAPVLGLQVLTVPGPPPALPIGPIQFEAWDNLLLAKALAAEAGGAIGTALGGSTGGAIGALGVGLGASAIVPSGVPVPMVVPPPQPALPSLPMVATVQPLQFLDGQDYVALTIEQLQTLLTTAQVVDLIAPHLAISSMVVQSVHVHRDDATGAAAEIEVKLKEIRFVSTISVPAPAATLPGASAPVSKGEQATSDAPSQKQSLAYRAVH